MSFLDDLMSVRYQSSTGMDLGLRQGQAYASYYPAYEVGTPQYNFPYNNYAVTQTAFLVNEFVYSIIIKRGTAEAEGKLRVNQRKGKDINPVEDHGLLDMIHNPNENMTEDDFWGIKRIFQDIAGFAAFEIEKNRLGEPIRLWPMLPNYCSFMRGQQEPTRVIRYQPYGLPYQDIPFFDPDGSRHILFFSNPEDYHPLYPGIRYYSPAMHCMPHIEADNAATWFLKDFWEHGTHTPGIISVAQSIDEATAQDYQRRWMQAHGGVKEFNKPPVMGLGTTWTPTTFSFKELAFSELDARTESRICDAFQIDPIVANARAGLDVSSYNNKKQASVDWYHDWVNNAWEKNAEVVTNQLIPLYGDDPKTIYCDFDVHDVYAMQEDRTAQVTRAVDMFKAQLVKRNDALKEMDMEPIDGPDGEAFFVQMAIRNQEPISPEGTLTQQSEQAEVASLESKTPPNQAMQDAKEAEKKSFRKFAKRRAAEGKHVYGYDFKYHDKDEQRDLMDEFTHSSDIQELAKAINKALEVSA